MSFSFDWVLINEIGLGKSPKTINDINFLKENNFRSVLSLCGEKEGDIFSGIAEQFDYINFVLPDHNLKTTMKVEDFDSAIKHLSKLMINKAVYVHCVASVERSPLVCMAWLIKYHNLNTIEALEYLKQIHKETNPLPSQLKVLNQFYKISRKMK
tara:strand:- start:540 stop:1004 length:465 start_codon:yes stop_codon:yes gene_type:complete